MPLIRQAYLVHVQDALDPDAAPVEHRLVIQHQDMLRGELELHKAQITERAHLNMTTAWCWAALTRLGLYTRPFGQFKDMDCQGLEDGGEEEVNPTQLATSDG